MSPWGFNTSTSPHHSRTSQQFLLSPHPVFLSKDMGFFDIFSFCVSVLGMYGAVVYLNRLLPRHIISNISTMLHDAQDTLARAVAAGAIPDISEPGADLESFASELARMRIHSHRSPGLFQQIRLAVRHRLTYRLYSLSSQISAVKLRIELAMDEQRLTLLVVPHNVVLTVVPLPANGVTKPTPPPPALVELDKRDQRISSRTLPTLLEPSISNLTRA
ncbi:hypothetical protein EDB89DRAFT_1949246 [Lactarius sanguifluus]|nr:hypothetical protein EDB89DRAFT_1949246 [Lactarius sanguifluus]